MARVILAMSGGVDSSVSAHLLRKAGHEVIGLFMRHGETSDAVCADPRTGTTGSLLPVISGRLDHKQGCCTASDAADARRVADRLDIPFHAIDFQSEFGRIMDYFVDEYSSGRTPNPCVMCNNWLKFGKLFEYADSVGAEYVATGHYARIEAARANGIKADQAAAGVSAGHAAAPGGEFALLRGIDRAKDQSYVLFGVEQRYLARMMLPVGGFRKPEIRQMAADLGLLVADKRDSQEICFVSSGDHADFVRQRREAAGMAPSTAGEIVTTEGQVVGRHRGIEEFTIGQRRGLAVAFGEPRYVVRIDADTRRVVIGDREALGRKEFTAGRTNWLVDPPAGRFSCAVQIRYNSAACEAEVELLDDGRMGVRLSEPRAGVAPGQAAVCYQGDRVLGGGWIE